MKTGATMLVSFIFFAVGILISTQLRDFSESLLFLSISTLQFIAYVFVSRMRQRSSFFWFSIASFASHGTFYMLMHGLKLADAYWLLLFPYVCGVVSGRTMGVVWSQWVERKFNLKADATMDPKLSPEKRRDLLKKEPMFWILAFGILLYTIYGTISFEQEMLNSLYFVVILGIFQNIAYTMTSRAAQRGDNWYIAATGMFQGVMFFVSSTFLLSKGVPAELAVPYILSSTLGANFGALLSMIYEWVRKLRPDEHLKKEEEKEQTKKKEAKKSRAPYVIILSLGIIWLIFQEAIFTFFGIPISKLVFPISAITFDMPRIVVMIAAALIIFLDSSLHTLSSRAGNRDHVGYHIASLVPKGTVDFWRLSYLALNSAIIDVVPVAVLAGCLGSLFAKDLAEKIERWLQARMDIPIEEPRKAGSATR